MAMLVLLWLTAGCTVGPRYSRPAAPAPAPMRGRRNRRGSKPRPRTQFPRANGGKFSTIPISTLSSSNCCRRTSRWSLRAIDLDQARSLARVATSGLFPQLSADPSAVRERGSGNRPLNGASPAVVGGCRITSRPFHYTQNVYTIPFDINYEVDRFRAGAAPCGSGERHSAVDCG